VVVEIVQLLVVVEIVQLLVVPVIAKIAEDHKKACLVQCNHKAEVATNLLIAIPKQNNMVLQHLTDHLLALQVIVPKIPD